MRAFTRRRATAAQGLVLSIEGAGLLSARSALPPLQRFCSAILASLFQCRPRFARLLRRAYAWAVGVLGLLLASTAFAGYSYLSQFGTSGSGKLFVPWGVAITPASYVLVADQGNNRVVVFDLYGHYLSQFGTAGSGPGQFNKPIGLAVDSTSGHILVAELGNNRVQIFDSGRHYLGQFGGPGSGPGQFGSFGPIGLAADPTTHRIVVGDYGNSRVQVFNSSGGFLFQFGTFGNGPGQFNSPLGIGIDPATSDIVVTDSGGRVQIFDSGGNYLSQFGSSGSGNGQFIASAGVAFDPTNGNLIVGDVQGSRVQIFDNAGDYIGQFGSVGSGNGQFLSFPGPGGIAVDPTSGKIFVVDEGNNRVQIFAAPYAFTLIDYPGAQFTQPFGINNKGQVALGTDLGSFVYQGGSFNPLPAPPAGIFLGANGINDSGTVVGGASDSLGSFEEGFILSGGVLPYSFFTQPGWTDTQARAIGNSGLVTGYSTIGSGFGLGESVGFIYDPSKPPGQQFTNIVPAANTTVIIAQGINAAGQVVGGFKVQGFGSQTAFLREPNGTINTFRINNGSTGARGINDNGLIAGFVILPTSTPMAFVGDSSGFQLLQCPARICNGVTGTGAEGINNAGQVVGSWFDAADGLHGFIATPVVMPMGTTANGAYTFGVDVVPNVEIFIDPAVAVGYDYAVGAGDPLFATVRLPIGIGDNLYTLLVKGKSFNLAGGDQFDFRTHGFPGGVAQFRVTGIETSAALDPTDPLAFQTGLTFVAAGRFTGTMTPIVVELLPPGTEFLHSSANDFLDTNAPLGPTAKYKDSPSLGRTTYREVGTWQAAAPGVAQSLSALGSLDVWLGLVNADDQGTFFDLQAQLLKNGLTIASGETLGIQGVTRNPASAKAVAVKLGNLTDANFGSDDVLALRVLAKVADSGGHSSAVGLRFYYDSASRPANFAATFEASP